VEIFYNQSKQVNVQQSNPLDKEFIALGYHPDIWFGNAKDRSQADVTALNHINKVRAAVFNAIGFDNPA